MSFLSKVVFFHLSQNICKRMQREGLKALYENDVAFALLVRCLAVLAFVPPNQVLDTYEALEHQMPDEMLPLLDYFERTYIGRGIGNQRRAPMFNIEFWNVHNRVINDDPRTNNKLEGHHNLLNSTLGFSHPTIWIFFLFFFFMHFFSGTKIPIEDNHNLYYWAEMTGRDYTNI